MPFKNWNFRQRPTGAFKWLMHVPVYLFRMRLGFVFGDRFILVTHVGRKSGELRQTPLEVVEHVDGEYIVCSGTGPGAQWYRNLQANPVRQVQVRNRRWRPAAQRFLTQEEAARRFAVAEQRRPRATVAMLKSTGNSYDGTDEGRLAMMKHLPMVAFGDTAADRAPN